MAKIGAFSDVMGVCGWLKCADSDSEGRTFESCQARQDIPENRDVFGDFAMQGGAWRKGLHTLGNVKQRLIFLPKRQEPSSIRRRAVL